MAEYIELGRTFQPFEAGADDESRSVASRFRVENPSGISWEELLEAARAVVLAEPGTGKTAEFREAANRLRANGQSAFLCRIELLSTLGLRGSLDIGGIAEFDAWLQGDHLAYLFLDSVDEARLSNRSAFDQALRLCAEELDHALTRVRIFVSCRVSQWRAHVDLELVTRLLPSPTRSTVSDRDESEADVEGAVPEESGMLASHAPGSPWVVYQLAPLVREQVLEFARRSKMADPDAFVAAIDSADAGIFAERPQDLLELMDYWSEHGQLGHHADMIEFNIGKKLSERNPNRITIDSMSRSDAREGAERLAAAVTFQRRSSILLLSDQIDAHHRASSVDPREPLPDWPTEKTQRLLDRAIFDEAAYGTVQFHHRSVREYLTARWLLGLLAAGKRRASVESLIFGHRYGLEVIMPAMRPIAAWLAVWDEKIRARLRAIAPEVLLEHGDPDSLPVTFRAALLRTYAGCRARGEGAAAQWDSAMIRRMAHPELGSVIHELLATHGHDEELASLLLEMVWRGRMRDCVEAALAIASDREAHTSARVPGIRAVADLGSTEQRKVLKGHVLEQRDDESADVLAALSDAFYPGLMSDWEFLAVLEAVPPSNDFAYSHMDWVLENICDRPRDVESAQTVLSGLQALLATPPFIDPNYCRVSERYAWLLPTAMSMLNDVVLRRHPFALSPAGLDICRAYLVAQHYRDLRGVRQEDQLALLKAWPELGLELVWRCVEQLREQRPADADGWIRLWEVEYQIQDVWRPAADQLEELFEVLSDQSQTHAWMVAVDAIFRVYVAEGRSPALRERMKQATATNTAVRAHVHTLLNPPTLPEEERKSQQRLREMQEGHDEKMRHLAQDRKEWQDALRQRPSDVRRVGDAAAGTVSTSTRYLHSRLAELTKSSTSHLGYAQWELLEPEFGTEVAQEFRDGCCEYWKGYDPARVAEWRTSDSIPWARIIGLTGLAMQARRDPDWVQRIDEAEAVLATRYAFCELNGVPPWAVVLRNAFPELFDGVIERELAWELHEAPESSKDFRCLSILRRGPVQWRQSQVGNLLRLLAEQQPSSVRGLQEALRIVLAEDLPARQREELCVLAAERVASSATDERKLSWLTALACVDGDAAVQELEAWLARLAAEDEKVAVVVQFCAGLSGGDRGGRGLAVRDYERPDVLCRLVSLVFEYVREEHDNRRDEARWSNVRDDAEHTRGYLLEKLLNTPGRGSFDAFMKLADVATDERSQERMRMLARKRAARDAAGDPWSGSAVADFATSGELSPGTEEDLLSLAESRLDEIREDLEDGDDSEAALWMKVEWETELRTVLANRLRLMSRQRYTVSSEEELADATMPDIRLHAQNIRAPVPIELKIAPNWTGPKLRERLENQLLGQYMRTSTCGVFLLINNRKTKINNRKRTWVGPAAPKRCDFGELVVWLQQEADALVQGDASVSSIRVIGIDLTKRPSEKPDARQGG